MTVPVQVATITGGGGETEIHTDRCFFMGAKIPGGSTVTIRDSAGGTTRWEFTAPTDTDTDVSLPFGVRLPALYAQVDTGTAYVYSRT